MNLFIHAITQSANHVAASQGASVNVHFNHQNGDEINNLSGFDCGMSVGARQAGVEGREEPGLSADSPTLAS